MKIKKNKKTIILDMDGTLYRLKGGSFGNSKLKEVILRNIKIFIAQKLKKDEKGAGTILKTITSKYKECVSVGLEKEYGIDRFEYFEYVWNIDPKTLIDFNPDLKKLLKGLKQNYNIVLISDAPRVWVNKILEFLEIEEVFEELVYSGEGDTRKEFGNGFSLRIKEMGVQPSNCISVGDQEHTDIIPAKKIGFKTVYVGEKAKSTADCSIADINSLERALELISKT